MSVLDCLLHLHDASASAARVVSLWVHSYDHIEFCPCQTIGVIIAAVLTWSEPFDVGHVMIDGGNIDDVL